MDKPITLITGTRKGIGRALVEHYTKKGHVVIGCSRFDIDWEIDNYQHLFHFYALRGQRPIHFLTLHTLLRQYIAVSY